MQIDSRQSHRIKLTVVISPGFPTSSPWTSLLLIRGRLSTLGCSEDVTMLHELIHPAPAHPELPAANLRVALVTAPFASSRSPSIQTGLLKAILQRRRI